MVNIIWHRLIIRAAESECKVLRMQMYQFVISMSSQIMKKRDSQTDLVNSVKPVVMKARSCRCLNVSICSSAVSSGLLTSLAGHINSDQSIIFFICVQDIASECCLIFPFELHLCLIDFIRSCTCNVEVGLPCQLFVLSSQCHGPQYVSPSLAVSH